MNEVGYNHPVRFVGEGDVAETDQSSLGLLNERPQMGFRQGCNFAIIDAVHSDRYTCDITTCNNVRVYNVPVLAQTHLINDEIYGELDLPPVGATVLVGFIDGSESKPYIFGTIIPFLRPNYRSGQTAVSSSSKAFTTRLLETGKENYYRKIFKSGTTVEVKDDGSVIVETPSGTYIKIDEGTPKKIIIEDSSGNKIETTPTALTIEDANGNKIETTTTSVKINGNFEVKQ